MNSSLRNELACISLGSSTAKVLQLAFIKGLSIKVNLNDNLFDYIVWLYELHTNIT